ncbi:MAG: hypothetical protein AAFY41_17665 [Bacteroidota bacterium]
MKNVIGGLSLCLIFFCCADPEPIITINEVNSEQFYLVGSLSGPTIDTDNFFFKNGYDSLDRFHYLHDNVLMGALGPTLITGMAIGNNSAVDGEFTISEIIRLHFWLPELPNEENVSNGQLEELLPIGGVIPFGQGLGYVTIGYRFLQPLTDGVPSMSSYLQDPIGELEILDVQDYTYEAGRSANSRTIQGKIVLCRFDGEIGIYNRDLDFAQDGQFGNFVTTERANISGEFRFFVETSN